ncbi:MAG: hypothetical protein CUN52_07970 [Phototrophicales bacterium]|nr:MAG: hypothetical protein CUN52_07970 [Phototrophicales bacterium]
MALCIIILLIGWLFIIHAGTENKRFHPDEALYTTFARNAVVHGDWLLTSPLDKPPLSIYANALSQVLFGVVITDKGVYDLPIRVGEFVARIPNLFAGMIAIALFIAIEKKIFRPQLPIGAISLILAPLFIQLSASAFTDMLMLMWVMASWLAIERRQSFWSGVLLMVGFATKPQAIFILPLLIMRGLWGKPRRYWLRWIFGMCIPFILLIFWDASRGVTSIFALGQYNYPTQTLINNPDNWIGRAWLWGEYLFWGANPFIVLGMMFSLFLWQPAKAGNGQRAIHHRQNPYFLVIFIVCYSLIHIVLGIPLYDRYALLIIPLIGLLASRYARIGILMGVLVIFVNIPIGRDGYPLDSEGAIITLAEEINRLPFAAVVYDHWRGWELGYYLGAWSEKRRVYYPNPSIQASDSLNNPERWTRYLVAPIDEPYDMWLDAMREVGYAVSLYKQIPHYIIFSLNPPITKSHHPIEIHHRFYLPHRQRHFCHLWGR